MAHLAKHIVNDTAIPSKAAVDTAGSGSLTAAVPVSIANEAATLRRKLKQGIVNINELESYLARVEASGKRKSNRRAFQEQLNHL